MADFQGAAKHVLDVEGGYQDHKSDRGNWLCGDLSWPLGKAGNFRCREGGKPTLIGTNRGISATVLANYLGRKITIEEQKNLSKETALAILKIQYWDRIKGDYILSQEVAQIYFDAAAIMHHSKATKLMQESCNDLGSSLKVDGKAGAMTVAAINGHVPAQLHNTFKEKVLDYIDRVLANDAGQQVFAAGWRNRFESYPHMDEALFVHVEHPPSSVLTSANVALEDAAISFADSVPFGGSFLHRNKWLLKAGFFAGIATVLLFLGHLFLPKKSFT